MAVNCEGGTHMNESIALGVAVLLTAVGLWAWTRRIAPSAEKRRRPPMHVGPQVKPRAGKKR